MFKVHVTYVIVLYAACNIIANVTAGKVTQLGPFSVPAAIYIFALTFTLLDLINHALGKAGARRVVYATLAANALLALYALLAVWLPAPPWFEQSESYRVVLAATPRIVLASLVAFLASGLLDVELFARLRDRLPIGWRVVLSNAAGTALDSALFITIAFAGVFPPLQLGMLMLGQYVVKLAVTAVSVPLVYLARGVSGPGFANGAAGGD